MTKFAQKKFGTPANSKAYVDNFDRVFRREGDDDNNKCHDCDHSLIPCTCKPGCIGKMCGRPSGCNWNLNWTDEVTP